MLVSRLKTLLSQSGLYSISWLASSMAGVLLLPVYTAYMAPSDYGIVQILDYTTQVLLIAIAAGQVPAVYRFFNDTSDPEEQRQVVATGFIYVALTAGLAVAVLYPFHVQLGELLLGAGVDSLYTQLALLVLLADVMILVPTAYFTVSQQPRIYVAYSLGRLALGIAANLYLIVHLEMGALGMLWGNLISSTVFALLMGGHMMAKNGFMGRWSQLKPMLMFGLPMIPALMASALVQSADRYFLRAFEGLDAVGIYSLGYKLPFFLCSLITSSFGMVWSSHMLYAIARDPDAKDQFARIATYFFTVFVFLMFSMALTASTVIQIMADDAYLAAKEVIPVVCIGLCVYAFHTFVTVGAYIQKRTVLIPISYLTALVVNLGLNYWLVPIYGYMGAAWVSVVTYFVFTGVGYLVCRMIYPINFQFMRLFKAAAVAVILYAGFVYLPALPGWWDLLRQGGLILLYPVLLFACSFLEPAEREFAERQLARLGGTPQEVEA